MKNAAIIKTAAFILTAAVIFTYFLDALTSIDESRRSEGKVQLLEALHRTAAACYAAEGVYPPSLEYMQEHYGIRISSGYTVIYDVFASNLMPDITVLEE